jgi:hypothetical protein
VGPTDPDLAELLRLDFPALCETDAFAADRFLMPPAAPASGWGVAEPHGRWVLGQGAGLVLPGLAEPGSCAIELYFTPFVCPPRHRFQDVVLSLNGTEVMKLRLTGHERIRMPIPAILAPPGTEMIFSIACPGAVSPGAVGGGPDGRVLGVALSRLVVVQNRNKRHFQPPAGMRDFPPVPPEGFRPPPAPLPPGAGPLLAICAILRNEGRYVEEWLAFHHAEGVRRFVLYDNGSTDDMAARIAAWPHAGCVSLVSWHGYDAQSAAYRHMLATHRDAAQWCAFIDCDEFIVPRGGGGLAEVLAALPEGCGGLFLHWLMFGSAGQHSYLPEPVTHRFTRRGHDDFPPNRVGKTMVRLSRAIDMRNPHIIGCQGLLLNDAGDEIDQEGQGIHTAISHRHVALHHYFTKSAEEWRWRRQGGRQAHDYARSEAEFLQYDVNALEDTTALRATRAPQPARV